MTIGCDGRHLFFLSIPTFAREALRLPRGRTIYSPAPQSAAKSLIYDSNRLKDIRA